MWELHALKEVQGRTQQCLRAARELTGRARDMAAVRKAAAALQALPARIALNPWMWDSPPLSESPAMQEEIQRTMQQAW